MDYYQFFSQLNNNTQANNNNTQSNDLISLPNVNNNSNQNNNNNKSTVNNSSFQEDNSNFMMSPDYQDMIEKQKAYKELIEKQKESQQQKQVQQPAVDSNLSFKLDNFMKAIERKLESLESSVSTLSQEFQSFSYHQSNYNNEFLRAISHLSNDISSTKNTIAQVSTVSTLSKSSSFSISPAFAEQLKGPSQEDIDAEIAKKLQDEFDRMAVSNNRPSPPPTPSNNIFPISSSSNLYPVSAANNIYGNVSPALPPVNNSPSGTSPNSPGERGECPFCNINLPLKDLQVHVESHLANNETPPPASNNPSLWNKLFGGKSNTQSPSSSQPKPPVNQPPKPITSSQPVYRPLVYPPQGSMVYRPMPGQPMPQLMSGQPMPMNGQPMNGQPMPMNGQPFPYPQGQQIIYVNPDGSPIYPK